MDKGEACEENGEERKKLAMIVVERRRGVCVRDRDTVGLGHCMLPSRLGTVYKRTASY